MRKMTMLLLAGLAAPGLAQAVDCSQVPVQQPAQPNLIAPVAGELAMVYNQLGAPGGVLAEAYNQSQSVDQVLLRIRTESCSNLATTIPAPGVVDPDNPAAYKPRTEFDNAPWRFNMNQNGKNMTADEFSAWMKARGVRVARGRAPTPAPVTVEQAGAAPGTVPVVEPAAPATPTVPVAPAVDELMPATEAEVKPEQTEDTAKPN